MTRLVLDSNALIALFDGDYAIADAMARFDQIVIPAVVLGEVRVGFNGTRRAQQAEQALTRLLERPNVSILDVTVETASFFVTIARQLKSQGTPIPVDDIWIAAGVMEIGASLCSRDGHFKHIPLLRIVDV